MRVKATCPAHTPLSPPGARATPQARFSRTLQAGPV